MVFRSGHDADEVRILVADSRDDVRSALRLLLEQDAGTVVSSEATRAENLIEQVRLTNPDVIMLDCDLPGLDADKLLPTLRSICPNIRVVALCARSEVRQAALSAGADAFVSKADPPQRLLNAIRQGSVPHASKPPTGNPGCASDTPRSVPGGCGNPANAQ